ncbi:MAG: RnfABCDGE type electron transport complex subunit G [Bacteroidales bacterium]|jgi:electron transport complex protein RnfG|nr:RnfABCDGE type electron transport complex subunit G [Bacteroidales bacterium]
MAQQKESSLFNMLTTLVVITLISGFALAYVNQLTIKPIQQAQLSKKKDALVEVLPEFDNNPVDTRYAVFVKALGDSVEVYKAYQSGELVGTAVNAFSPDGYSGDVRIMVGFLPDGTIHAISVLEQTETPGLGTKMTEAEFIDQFADKNPKDFKMQVVKDGGQVDAITAATISSRAFCDALQMAYAVCVDSCDANTGATSTDEKTH